MQVVQLKYPLQKKEYKTAVAAIGYFDGVHLGHQGVIKKAIHQARENNVHSALITFHPHPREILKTDEITHYITPLDDKLEILQQLGLDIVYIIEFTWDFSQISPLQFVKELLLPLGILDVVVGFDFRFGKGGSGTPQTLKEACGGKLGVQVIESIEEQEQKISSSLIRQQLLMGKIEDVNRHLDRPLMWRGTVIHGNKRGREIGFPTANIMLADNYFLPCNGVYGVRVEINNTPFYGVMNIGTKPTFNLAEASPTVEIHLLDFNQEIYGQSVRVALLFYIRSEQKFSNIDSLRTQIALDIVFAKEKFLCYTI